ncbi:MAG: S-methyl-5'-thioadenosine phosphorylase [Myxococcales bacterium]|nr:S-methyl-5'-thioadenosine phosphorylase [Myxococcales bacterium]
MSQASIGVIGGSGLYEIQGLTDVKEVAVETPFGPPSDKVVLGTLEGKRVAFLPRHGKGHRISPSEINYRANIYALKSLGVQDIIAVSAVGSMREEIVPGHIVIIDQFYDHTKHRKSTFFEGGVVAHAHFADPICSELADVLEGAARRAGATVHRGGTYLNMEGPQFSTRAESKIYRQWGVSVIGMTNATEAKLACEAEICYSTVALATDYDCWHETEEDVTIEAILAVIAKNVETAKRIIKEAVAHLPTSAECHHKHGMQFAIVTDKSTIPPAKRKDLDVLIGKYL